MPGRKGITDVLHKYIATGHNLFQRHLRQTLVGADDQFGACHVCGWLRKTGGQKPPLARLRFA